MMSDNAGALSRVVAFTFQQNQLCLTITAAVISFHCPTGNKDWNVTVKKIVKSEFQGFTYGKTRLLRSARC